MPANRILLDGGEPIPMDGGPELSSPAPPRSEPVGGLPLPEPSDSPIPAKNIL